MKTWKDRTRLLRGGLPTAAVGARGLMARAAVPGTGPGSNAPAASTPPAPTPAPLQSTPPPDVIEWLAQLTLLHGVPFQYLVPYAALLPQEALRFFYVDDNWLDRLVDGALSIGVASTQDNAFNSAWYEAVYEAVAAERGRLRAKLRGRAPQGAGTTTSSVISGFLMRSSVVSAWPGVEVRGTAGGVALPILRLDRLSSTVLLCLFDGVPDTVRFAEPGEGLRFGVLIDEDGSACVLLRGLGLPAGGSLAAGAQIAPQTGAGNLKAPASFRTSAEPGVLDVAALRDSIQSVITSSQVPGNPGAAALPGGQVTPAAFAIQLVRGAGLLSYETPRGGA